MENFEIKVSVINANATKTKDESLGTYNVDASHIYCSNSSHFITRRWVGLVDERCPSKVRGWLKLSIAIVGPNDKTPHEFSGTKAFVDVEEVSASRALICLFVTS